MWNPFCCWGKEWVRLPKAVGDQQWHSDHPHGSPMAEENSQKGLMEGHWRSSVIVVVSFLSLGICKERLAKGLGEKGCGRKGLNIRKQVHAFQLRASWFLGLQQDQRGEEQLFHAHAWAQSRVCPSLPPLLEEWRISTLASPSQ